MFQRYAVIHEGQITATISWAGDAAPDDLPAGTTLMLESDAIAQGIPRAVPVGKSVGLAQEAIQANRANIAQDRGLITQALALANGSGSMTLTQLTGVVRQLALAVAVLAHSDAMANRQRIALIVSALDDFDRSGANTATGDITAAPGNSVAAVPPTRPGSSSTRAAVPADAVADAPTTLISTP